MGQYAGERGHSPDRRSCAVTAAIMAQAYGADAKFAASATLWSTLASIVTLPVTTFLGLYWFQP